MKSLGITELENHRLSDGGLARVTKIGRKYNFCRTYDDLLTPPDVTTQLDKQTAYKMLADMLKADVLDEDY